jgi:hypothetical protein
MIKYDAFLRSTDGRADVSSGEIIFGVASRLLADAQLFLSDFSVLPEYVNPRPLFFRPDPEYRGPAKYVVTEAFCSKAELRQLACELIDMRPTDFRPRSSPSTRSATPSRSSLLHYLDRARMLEPFLEQAHAIKPHHVREAGHLN